MPPTRTPSGNAKSNWPKGRRICRESHGGVGRLADDGTQDSADIRAGRAVSANVRYAKVSSKTGRSSTRVTPLA